MSKKVDKLEQINDFVIGLRERMNGLEKAIKNNNKLQEENKPKKEE
jgi:hypothetical protein